MSSHQRIAITTAVVFLLMLVEARRSARNVGRLRAAGALEPSDDVYPLMRVLYPLAFLVPAGEGWFSTRYDTLWPSGLLVFLSAKALKYWAVAALGDLWSFQVLVLPGRPLVKSGPYRFLRHPNYVGVAGEIAGNALLCGAPWTGALFTLGFTGLMLRRIRVEERALAISAR
jgi:methyltransferase